MIPLELRLEGFLSYRTENVLDFTNIHIACISGANGAGKSTLLDAITWALFGRTRASHDDDVIHLKSDQAHVSLTFAYENAVYRIIRIKPRGKTMQLEFQIRQADGSWKPLTEASMRQTSRHIVDVLRLDYDTFTNAAFFLQGQAASFSQKSPKDRKQILASILGLEQWNAYRLRASEARRLIEQDAALLHARLEEIEQELQEEETRKQRLAGLQKELENWQTIIKAREEILHQMRLLAARIDQETQQVNNLSQQAALAQKRVTALEENLRARQEEYALALEVGARAQEIEAAYQTWQQLRAELQAWDEVAARFHQHQERRRPILEAIQTARAGLEQERKGLIARQSEVEKMHQQVTETQANLENTVQALQECTTQLAEAEALRARREQFLAERAHLQTENQFLRAQMDPIKKRQEDLKAVEGSTCPVCGQPLGPAERAALIEQLQAEGTRLGDAFRANKTRSAELEQEIAAIETQLQNISALKRQHQQYTAAHSALEERLRNLEDEIQTWESTGLPRLAEIDRMLAEDDFAHQARAQLAELDAEGLAIGYDAAAHEKTRQAEMQARQAETDMRTLEGTRSTLKHLEREIEEQTRQLTEERAHLTAAQTAFDQAAQQLEENRRNLPDLTQAEQDLLTIQEKENRLRTEVILAEQSVRVLDERRQQRKELLQRHDDLQRTISRYKQLDTAFGPKGIPALLIEAALPEIETYANEILDRLSNGSMRVHFATQSAYQSAKRQHEKKETLDIQIQDHTGEREYGMYSGGEAFRVDFAIRLALSRLLAHRAGARLQTLVIDEGFGSQDEQGRQRLVEAINSIKDDFTRILVITHVESLKDAFPVRIEVEKDAESSTLRVF
ncbi:MAG: hypothetical protein Fur0018_15130 [Anaerolineales bacterium]